MSNPVDLYNTTYRHTSADVHRAIRAETYDLDLGQTSWMTAEEFRGFFKSLELSPASRVLEIASGAGGCALYMAEQTGAHVLGIDINENAVAGARELALSRSLDSLVNFERVNAGERLPFPDASFDALFCNDAICHIPGRLAILRESHRVLRPGGRILYTDPVIVTGPLANEEIATRSSIGYYLFLPPGENERLLSEAGLELLRADDFTPSVAAISKRWHDARLRHRDPLLSIEGESTFAGLQKFLACTHTLAAERRLSRFAFLSRRP